MVSRNEAGEINGVDHVVDVAGRSQSVQSDDSDQGGWPLVEAGSSAVPVSATLAKASSTASVMPEISAFPAVAVGPVPVRGPASASPFETGRFLKDEAAPVPTGWRSAVRAVTFGRVTPAPSAAQRREQARHERIVARITNCQKVAFASGKGGVGKTTATVLCGTALALNRLDRIVALDANPDAGSLGWKVPRETESTLTDLLRYADRIERYSDVRALTNQADSRLEILASENDPAVSHALGEADFARAIAVLERFYSVVLCDLGTGLLDSATQGIFRLADQVVVITAPSVDAGRVANFTLDFVQRRYPKKVREAVVIINTVRKDGLVDVKELSRHFGQRVRSVVQIPFDRHLATGGAPEWKRLRPATRDAYLEAAAAIADGLTNTGRSFS